MTHPRQWFVLHLGGHRLFRAIILAALAAAFAQIVSGGVVRVTSSGLGCPDWPLCHGGLIPPLDGAALVEYAHRLSAALVGVLSVAAAVLAWKAHRRDRRVTFTTTLAVVLVLVAAALGGLTVLTELAWWWVLVHLAVAEALVGCLVAAACWGWEEGGSDRSVRRGHGGAALGVMVLVALGGTLGLILSGSYMVGYGAGSSCATWPLCRGGLLPDGGAYVVHMAHRFVAAFAGAPVVAAAGLAWSRRAAAPGLGVAAVGTVVLFLAQVLVGAATVLLGFPTPMRAVHLGVATSVWIGVVLLAALVHGRGRVGASGSGDAAASVGRRAGATG